MIGNVYGFPMSTPLIDPNGPRWNIPERLPGALQDSGSLTQFSGGPLSQLAYDLAGRPKRPPFAGSMLAASDYTEDSTGGGGASQGLSLLQNARQANQLADKLNDYAAAQQTGITPGANGAPANIDLSSTNLGNVSPGAMFGTNAGAALGSSAAAPIAIGGAADLASIGAGAMFGTSGAAALGAAPAAPISLFGSGAADLGSIGAGQMFGTSGGAAAAGVDAGAGSAAAGAGNALGTLGTGLGYAGLVIGAGELVHSAFNAHGDEIRNKEAFTQAMGVKPLSVNMGKTMQPFYLLPDGRVLGSKDYEKLAGAWYGATYAPDGEQERWQKEYDELNSSMKSTPLPKGWVVKNGQIVRG